MIGMARKKTAEQLKELLALRTAEEKYRSGRGEITKLKEAYAKKWKK